MARSKKNGDPATRKQAAEIARDATKAGAKSVCLSAAASEAQLVTANEVIATADEVREKEATQMIEQQAMISQL